MWLLTVPNGATTSATTTTAKPDAEQLKKMADDQLQLQDAVSAMLVQTHAIGSCESPDVQVQFKHTTTYVNFCFTQPFRNHLLDSKQNANSLRQSTH